MIMAFSFSDIFDSNRNNGSYLHVLNNFRLPQLQDFFNTRFENGSF